VTDRPISEPRCHALAKRGHVLLTEEIRAARLSQKADASLVAVDVCHWLYQGCHFTTKDSKSTKGSKNKMPDALFVLCHVEASEVTVNFDCSTANHSIRKLVEFHLRALRVLRGDHRTAGLFGKVALSMSAASWANTAY